MTRHHPLPAALLAAALLLAPIPLHATPKPTTFHVEETTIADTLTAIRTGKVTCRQLVEIYLKRIAAYDQKTLPGQPFESEMERNARDVQLRRERHFPNFFTGT